MNEQEEDVKRLQAAIDSVSDFYDAVQIFATRHESGSLDGTVAVHLGVGNWYARYGHVHEWVIKQDEYSRMKSRENP